MDAVSSAVWRMEGYALRYEYKQAEWAGLVSDCCVRGYSGRGEQHRERERDRESENREEEEKESAKFSQIFPSVPFLLFPLEVQFSLWFYCCSVQRGMCG